VPLVDPAQALSMVDMMGDMGGTGGMGGMVHSKMPGMGAQPAMAGMDHGAMAKMPGMNHGAMAMDHSRHAMGGMGARSTPPPTLARAAARHFAWAPNTKYW